MQIHIKLKTEKIATNQWIEYKLIQKLHAQKMWNCETHSKSTMFNDSTADS